MYNYFEDAIESENRDLKHKVLFPSKSTFLSRRWDEWDRNSQERTINSNSRLIISHTDADGFVSSALFVDYFDDTGNINVDYSDLEWVFNYIEENETDISELYVSDLNLDEVYSSIETVAEQVETFVWLDHHKWGDKEERLQEIGVDLTVNENKCGAELVLEYLEKQGYEPTESAREIVNLTADHDLWKHNMEEIQLGEYSVCISEVFSNFAFYSDTDEFIDTILKYGNDFLDYEEELLRDGYGQGFLAQKEAESAMKIQYVLDNEVNIKKIEEYTVAFAYGRVSPGSLLEQLAEKYDIDILVHTKPSYPVKLSFRSTDNFQNCHKLAEEFGGGGHSQAAGCNPELFQEPLEFFEYISNRGQPLQQEVEDMLQYKLPTL